MAEWLCKKVGVSSECMQVGDWRMPKSMGIVSGIVLVMPDHLQAAVFRLGKSAEGTSNVKNAEISIDNEDVNSLLLAPETTKVYVGGSVAVLKDALNKGGQEYKEARKGGARSRGWRRGGRRRDCEHSPAVAGGSGGAGGGIGGTRGEERNQFYQGHRKSERRQRCEQSQGGYPPA